MRLLYDNLIYYLQINGGISTYWYELTSRFLKEEQISISFYEPNRKTENVLRRKLQLLPKQIKRTLSAPVLERLIKLPHFDGPHIFHSSYFRLPIKRSSAKVVTTIHDFTHEKYYSGLRTRSHQYFKKEAVKASERIIVVSEHTKNDLLNFYPGIDESIVQVIYHGASPEYKVIQDITHNSEAPFFLFVGSREHYKNFDFAVKITAKLENFKLYIVGSPLNEGEQKMLKKMLGKRYRSFQNIDNEELNLLYNTAFCLLYPSSNEGFGIPMLEAMQAGCPFVALNASSIPEVAGEAGIILEALSVDEALGAIETITNLRNTIVDRGLLRAQKFSWDRCFDETYGLYRSIAS